MGARGIRAGSPQAVALAARMRALWADPEWRAVRRKRRGGKSRSRFAAFTHDETLPALELQPSHPAVVNARSIFNVTVPPSLGDHILIDGANQRKIGHRIVKGPWAWLPVYTLSLEERATCPTSCKVWRGCYGNSMPFAKRWKHGSAFERALLADLFYRAGRHPNGYAVRIHVLGDFYSVAYVNMWRDALSAIPGLRVWGYTAHRPDSEIGRAVRDLNADFQWRCAVRFSGSETIVIRNAAEQGDAIICPVETGAATNCGSCALCWAPAARDKTIAFLFHSGLGSARGRGRKQERKAA